MQRHAELLAARGYQVPRATQHGRPKTRSTFACACDAPQVTVYFNTGVESTHAGVDYRFWSAIDSNYDVSMPFPSGRSTCRAAAQFPAADSALLEQRRRLPQFTCHSACERDAVGASSQAAYLMDKRDVRERCNPRPSAANALTTRSHSFAPWPRCTGGDSARCRYDDLVIPPWHPSREAMLGLDGIIAVSQWQVRFGPRLRLSGTLVTVRGGGTPNV